MKLGELCESVMSPVQEKMFKSVEATVKKMDSETDVALKVAYHNDWMTIKIGNNTISLKVEHEGDRVQKAVGVGTLHLSDMYLPDHLKGKGLMTSILKNLKTDLGSSLNGKCKVHVPMDQAGWEKIVTRGGFEWVPPISREDFLKQLRGE